MIQAAMQTPVRTRYLSISKRGIDFDSVPMRLFQKSKKLGVWDGMLIDLEQDKMDWAAASIGSREGLIGTTALFQAGEEAVTLDLLPLVGAMARAGRLEEEIYLTSFLWEEAKHCEFFRRWLNDVADATGDLHDQMGPNYSHLFFVELPTAMGRLATDDSPEALARALTTYNMMIEGVLAETGYYSYSRQLEKGRLFPGLAQALRLISRDETRHIRFGVYMLQLLIQEHPGMWDVVQARMNELLPYVLGMLGSEENPPPGDGSTVEYIVPPDELTAFAMTQFQRRMRVLERARTQSRVEVEEETSDELTEEFFAG